MSGFTGIGGPLLHSGRGAFRGLPIQASKARKRFSAGSISTRSYWWWEDDFFEIKSLGDITGSYDWTETDIGTQTLNPTTFIVTDTAAGVLRISSDATNNDGIHLQYTGAGAAGEFLVPISDRILAVEFRVAHANWDRADWFIGLAETSATLIDNAGDLTSDNIIGFRCKTGTTTANQFDCRAAGTATANQANVTKNFTPTLTDATYYRFGIRIEGTSKCEWWFDGDKVAETTLSTAFDDGMCFSFGNVMTSANADNMDIDYIVAAGTR
jgi:hypothetical protein